MDSEEEVGSGNNSNDGAIEGRGHSNTWDFEEGEYLAPFQTSRENQHIITSCVTYMYNMLNGECGLLLLQSIRSR